MGLRVHGLFGVELRFVGWWSLDFRGVAHFGCSAGLHDTPDLKLFKS